MRKAKKAKVCFVCSSTQINKKVTKAQSNRGTEENRNKKNKKTLCLKYWGVETTGVFKGAEPL